MAATAIDLIVCECGCGGLASRLTATGSPRRFIHGHGGSPNWKGGRSKCNGYIMVYQPDHQRAGKRGYVYEHVLVAGLAMGKAVPERAQVHHVNGVKTDNRPANLVVCEDLGYHRLLHQRADALAGCGNANARRCVYCHRWDDPKNMSGSRNPYHKSCAASRRRFKLEHRNRSHVNRSAAWRRSIGVDLDALATETERAWQAHCAPRETGNNAD